LRFYIFNIFDPINRIFRINFKNFLALEYFFCIFAPFILKIAHKSRRNNMNKKVTKLLSKYASISDTNLKELKKWWHTLSWQEKTEERKRMEAELTGEEEAVEETAEETK
jgi:hypothetical protein